ncbi:hypothetical protein PflCFBP13517_18230 [Pseudomonas fluorescens]|nr:hypothetical protein PflCFBP13517_18230 [Pseudomonas fluorescens]
MSLAAILVGLIFCGAAAFPIVHIAKRGLAGLKEDQVKRDKEQKEAFEEAKRVKKASDARQVIDLLNAIAQGHYDHEYERRYGHNNRLKPHNFVSLVKDVKRLLDTNSEGKNLVTLLSEDIAQLRKSNRELRYELRDIRQALAPYI